MLRRTCRRRLIQLAAFRASRPMIIRPMNSRFLSGLAFAGVLFVAYPTWAEKISVGTKDFTLNFQVGDDHRLYQQPIGMDESNWKLQRDDEYYPQAGDGYVWEPALQVTHADGNTSTALLLDQVSQTNETPDRVLTRIQLRDPAYPLEVTLCFRTHNRDDVIEEWTEI